MTISTHVRVQRGYYRRYYAEHADVIRAKNRVHRLCHYRNGFALQLLAELREHWKNESQQLMENQPTPDCPTISKVWTTFACDGPSKPSTGRPLLRIRSTG